MGEDLDPLTTEEQITVLSHRGILLIMAGTVLVAAVAGYLFGGTMFGVGVVFGGVLSFVNYLWLDRSTKALFAADERSSVLLLGTKYFLRYAVIGGVLYLVYLTGAVPLAAVIAGLSAFAIAVVLQGVKNIFTSTF